jgi:hypothetical protein
MLDRDKVRFRRAEDALRFFFRLRELLHGGRTRRLAADELPAYAGTFALHALDDYRCIGCTMKQLDDFALWLLSEIYGPTCFGVHRRTFSHALKVGRLVFPRLRLRPREIGLIHARALNVVRRGLQELDMIPSDRLPIVRARSASIQTLPGRARLGGSQSANRV